MNSSTYCPTPPTCLILKPNTSLLPIRPSAICDLVGYREPELISLEWPRIMADAGETGRAEEEISGRREDVFRTNDFGFRKQNGSRVDANVLYRVMRVSDRNGPTRHLRGAPCLAVFETWVLQKGGFRDPSTPLRAGYGYHKPGHSRRYSSDS